MWNPCSIHRTVYSRSRSSIAARKVVSEIAAESSESQEQESEGSEYQRRESTPSSSSSNDGNQDKTLQYLTHDGETYHYKLKRNFVRCLVNDYDVSQAFFNYRDAAISKAEDLQILNEYEQLALEGIMLIDNRFVNTDIAAYEEAQHILNDID